MTILTRVVTLIVTIYVIPIGEMMRSTSLGLIFAGLAAMATALFMDTTRHGIYNIGLLSNQNTAMIFGGFLFIGGIVLLGISKKSSAEGTTREPENAPSETNERQSGFSFSLQTFESNIIDSIPRWADDSLMAKILVGSTTGLPFTLIFSVFNPLLGLLAFAGFVWYSTNGKDATYNLLYVMSGVFFVIACLVLIFGIFIVGFFEAILTMTIPALIGELYRIALKTRASVTQ